MFSILLLFMAASSINGQYFWRSKTVVANSLRENFLIPAQIIKQRGLQLAINIGTPAKLFKMEVMFMAEECLLLGKKVEIPADKYIPNDSKSYKNLSSHYHSRWFGDGQMASDIFSFMPNDDAAFNWKKMRPKFEPIRQQFAILEVAHSLSYNNNVSGLLGLKPLRDEWQNPQQFPTFMQNLAKQFGGVASLSFWFPATAGHDVDLPDEMNATITIGGIDAEHCAKSGWQFTKAPNKQSEWRVRLDEITVLPNMEYDAGYGQKTNVVLTNNANSSSSSTLLVNTTAIFEPGRLLFSLGPAKQLKKLATLLGSTEHDGGIHLIPCNTTARIQFSSADGTFRQILTADEFVLKSVLFDGKCMLTFWYWGAEEWLFGLRFFNSKCLQMKLDQNLDTLFVGFGPTIAKLNVFF